MKKILTVLLLLTFCTVQATWAGDIIIIGSDGQARYEDETKNIPVTQNVIENTKQKNILNEVTITDDTVKRENIYIDYKGNVKKIEKEQITEEQVSQITTTVDKAKEAEYQRYIQNAPKTLYISKDAINSRSQIKCDTIIIDDESKSDTIPKNVVKNNSSYLEHEATVSKISKEKLFYLMSRGLTEEQAKELLIIGFIDKFKEELPMEYAVELNALLKKYF